MPETGHSISVRIKTAETIRENSKNFNRTVDAYLNHLMTLPQQPKPTENVQAKQYQNSSHTVPKQ